MIRIKRPHFKKPNLSLRPDLALVLADVIRRDGGPLFLSLLKDRAQAMKSSPDAMKWTAKNAWDKLQGLLGEIRAKGFRKTTKQQVASAVQTTQSTIDTAKEMPGQIKLWFEEARNHYQTLPTAKEKREFASRVLLYSSSFMGGFYLGYALPRWDLRILQKGTPLNRILLPSAPMLTMDVTLEWFTGILEKIATHPKLDHQSKDSVEVLRKLLYNLNGGVSTGFVAHEMRGKKRAFRKGTVPLDIALDARAFKIAEEFFLTLVGRKS